jgi:hypothetical protein
VPRPTDATIDHFGTAGGSVAVWHVYLLHDFDQMDVISSKVTHIDRLKGLDLSSTLAGVTEVFGVGVRGVESRFRPDWLSPFARVCFPPSVQDEVMGFCQPCLGGNKNKTEKETELPARTAARSMEEIV